MWRGTGCLASAPSPCSWGRNGCVHAFRFVSTSPGDAPHTSCGPEGVQVYWACIAILCSAYAGGVAMGLASKVLWSRVVTVRSAAGGTST